MDCKDGEHPELTGAGTEPVVTVDFEVYPEPKALSAADLAALAARHGGWVQAGRVVGVSEGFIRQNADQLSESRQP